jgi:hypothetical protein
VARPIRGALRAPAAIGLLVLAACAAVAAPSAADAQEPTPDTSVSGPVDPRSDGGGPGLEAEPLVVLLGVVLLGAVTVAGTLVYVRVTRDD